MKELQGSALRPVRTINLLVCPARRGLYETKDVAYLRQMRPPVVTRQ